MNFIRAILLICLMTTSLSPMKSPGTNNLRGKLVQLKTSLVELRSKLVVLKAKLESLRILLNKKEEPVTEKNVWDKIKDLVQKQNGSEFNLTPEIIDESKLLDNQLSTLKTDMAKIKDNIVIDNKYFEGINLELYVHGLTVHLGDDVNKSKERAVMLFKHLCEKVGPVILDTTPKSCNSIAKRIEQLKARHNNMYSFLTQRNEPTTRDIWNKKDEKLNYISKLINEIKIGMFNRLQEIFFYLYKGYQYKQNQFNPPMPSLPIDLGITDKKALIENFALKFNNEFNDIDKVFINSFRVLNYRLADEHNIDDADATRKAFPKLVWFLLANMFKPSNDSLLIKSWNKDTNAFNNIQFDGFSAIINLPLPFWGLLQSKGSLEISDNDAKSIFTELDMPGTTVATLKAVLGSETDEETIDDLNSHTKLDAQYIQALKLNNTLSIENKVKSMLIRYSTPKYHIDEIKKDFWQDDNLDNLRHDANVDEDVLLSTGNLLDDNTIQNYLNDGKIQFLLMRMFLKELSPQNLFDILNSPTTAEEIKEMIIEGIRQKNNTSGVSYFPQEVTDAIKNGTLSEQFIKNLFETKQSELRADSTNLDLQAVVLRLKAIVWTFKFIDENGGDEKEKIDTRNGFVKFVTGQSRPPYILVTAQAYWHTTYQAGHAESIQTHTCYKETSIPTSLLEKNDYDLFKTALIGVI